MACLCYEKDRLNACRKFTFKDHLGRKAQGKNKTKEGRPGQRVSPYRTDPLSL